MKLFVIFSILVLGYLCLFTDASDVEDNKADGDIPILAVEEPCPRSYIAGRVGMCTRKLTKATLPKYRGEVCNLQRRFIRCMERLTRMCNISSHFERNLVSPIRDANRKLCQPEPEEVILSGRRRS